MIVGETRTIRHRETGESAFVFDTTPTLAVTQPDGEAVSPAPTVTVSPGTSSVTQTLSAVVAFPQAGAYRMAWSLDVGADNPIVRIEDYFATWTDVASLVRRLLNRTASQLPDATIEAEMARLVRLLTTDYSCLGSYNALTGNDQAFFDDALGYMVAASLRPVLGRQITDGDLVRRREGDTEYTFADRTKSGTLTTEQEWTASAWASFRRIACIAAGQADLRNALRWSLNGRRRAAEKAGNIIADTNPFLRYLVDEERRQMGIGVYV